MKNYISLNGKKIELTEDQITKMQECLGLNRVALSSILEGELFKIGKFEFIVLEHANETTAVIMKDLLHKEKCFGDDNNNYKNSDVDDLCVEFGCEIEELVGEGNLVEHTVDLTSDDGLRDYGTVKRYMSLLTADLYRRYVEILDKHKLDAWWWLATPWSTPTHGYSATVKCVAPSGNLNYVNYINNVGVRPFCILKSNILVSK